jgi:acetyl esterase
MHEPAANDLALELQARALLDLVARLGRPTYDQLPPPEAREQYRQTRAAMQPAPPDLAGVEDRAAAGPAGPIPLRLYRPERGTILPALVYFHGGGWVIGDLDTHDVLCRQLAERAGVAVVAVDYRLAPEHRFPAAVEDAWAATTWIASHAAELGIDPGALAVAGDSAGGNLAAVMTLLARDRGGPGLRFQLLIYPATDLRAEAPSHHAFADGYLLTRSLIHWFRAQYVREDADLEDWRASPLLAASVAGVPPALVMTAGFDPLRDEGEAYARRLRDAGVTVDYVCYGGMIHGFLPAGRMLDTATRAVSHAATSLRQALTAPAKP